MAKPLHKHAIFLLAFISCLQFLFIDGRPIKSINKQLEVVQKDQLVKPGGSTSTINLHLNNGPLAGQHRQEQKQSGFSDSAATSKDGFRPTAPGFSPGVGHPKAVVTSSSTIQHLLTTLENDHYDNLHKSSRKIPDNVQQSASGKEEMSPTNLDASAEASTNGFRPTAPGFSPGVGHSKAVPTSLDASAVASKDDFRPTSPGFSPGVGHPKDIPTSLAASKKDFRPTSPGFSPGVGHPKSIPTSLEASTLTSKDNFRPTSPGFSPGVGHPKSIATSLEASALTSKYNFRPTSPGFSPGVGHPKAVVTSSVTTDNDSIPHNAKKSMPGKEETLPPVSSTGFDASAVSSKDDFRPTDPGYSPGVGHLKKVVTSSSEIDTSVSGYAEDYRPTQPGHSPGVGHSYEKANAGHTP